MSDVMNPMDTGETASRARTASATGQAPQIVEVTRPGMVTFAAVMLFLAGGFAVVWAIQEFVAGAWVKSNLATYGYSSMAGYLWAWGIFDLILAAVAIYAGIDLLRGGPFGLIIGLTIAGVSAIRWFFYLPVAPWLAVTIIAIDVLIIYGLVANTDYFENAQLQ